MTAKIIARKALRPLLASAILYCALPAHATVVTSVAVNDGTQAGTMYSQGAETWTVSSASAHTQRAGGAAYATHGVLKSTFSSSISSGSSSGGAGARYSDVLNLSNDSLYGKQGVVTFAYYFDYDQSVDATGQGFANGSLSFTAWANSSYGWFMDYANTDTGGYTMYESRENNVTGRTYGVPRTNYLYVTTGFTWGQAISTSFEITSSAGAYVPSNDYVGTASYNFNAGNSGYWAGVVSASADGQVVTDYRLSSQSGTDYSRSFVPANDVPEPATWAILLSGLAMLAMQRRRRKQAL